MQVFALSAIAVPRNFDALNPTQTFSPILVDVRERRGVYWVKTSHYVLTSNQSFGAWGEVFGDRVIATAILDRLLHHAVTINIRGNSYRLKEKHKAGLLRPADSTDSQQGAEI
jgi:hypothetical protein